MVMYTPCGLSQSAMIASPLNSSFCILIASSAVCRARSLTAVGLIVVWDFWTLITQRKYDLTHLGFLQGFLLYRKTVTIPSGDITVILAVLWVISTHWTLLPLITLYLLMMSFKILLSA
jgi:hypothetical protein